jgi:hypothetical protein
MIPADEEKLSSVIEANNFYRIEREMLYSVIEEAEKKIKILRKIIINQNKLKNNKR